MIIMKHWHLCCVEEHETSAKTTPAAYFDFEFFSNTFIAGHEHSTRDSRRKRLISINPIVT